MSYIDVLREAEDQVTPGMSACQGCGGELILRKLLQVSGKDTITGIPPGCMPVPASWAGTAPTA